MLISSFWNACGLRLARACVLKQKLHEHIEKFRFLDEGKTKLYSKNGIKDSDSVSKTEFKVRNITLMNIEKSSEILKNKL